MSKNKRYEKSAPDKRNDRTYNGKRKQLEMVYAQEADMEARQVLLEGPRMVTVVCAACKSKNTYELGQGVPVAPCQSCGAKVALRPMGRFPEVTTR